MGKKKILVFGPNWIGDTIMSTPMISSLKRAFPSSYVVMSVKPYVSSLWETNPYIDEIWPFDAPSIYKGLFSYFKFFRKIRKYRFDLTIILPHYFRWAILSFLAGIANRVGYNTRHRGFFLTISLKYNFRELLKIHMVENYLDILRSIGIKPEVKELFLGINSGHRYSAVRILEENGVNKNDIVVGLAPGAMFGRTKRWPKDHFAELADKLIDEYKAKILILGGPQEKELSCEIARLMRNLPIAPEGNLMEVGALIERCDVLVSNDSGLMHIGAAVKTKTAAIFLSTSSTWARPYSEGNAVVEKLVNCSPCYQRQCPYGTYDCLKSVSVDDVFKVVSVKLNNKIVSKR